MQQLLLVGGLHGLRQGLRMLDKRGGTMRRLFRKRGLRRVQLEHRFVRVRLLRLRLC